MVYELVEQDQNSQETEINARFAEIVAAIDSAASQLSTAELESLHTTPVCKPQGYADQGYRHG